MPKCGLLGEKLPHSFSPQIHRHLGDYEYTLIEKRPEEVEAFLAERDFDAINVTVPYKIVAYRQCDSLSDTARAIGSVNTVVRRSDGTLYGDNTDAFGFEYLLRSRKIEIEGRRCMVLGSGGSSVTVCHVLKKMGAASVDVIRHRDNRRELLEPYFDKTNVIVNATPVGMYPGNGLSPISLADFTRLTGVVDLIYNPARTALILEAERMSVPAVSGLRMLVAQAVRAYEVFFDRSAPTGIIEEIYGSLTSEVRNIVLIGMPGCGKSTVARILSEKTGREAIDLDDRIIERAGKSIPDIFAEGGEPLFRSIESEVVSDFSKRSGKIIATGGGAVTVPSNIPNLRQNGILFFINRPIDQLPTDGRPLSKAGRLAEMYQKRLPIYRAAADYEIAFQSSEQVAGAILATLKSRAHSII